MLHKEAVTPDILKLLINLQNDPRFSDFILVGGTALALQIGHRKSEDIDLFIDIPFPVEEYVRHLVDTYDFRPDYMQQNTIRGSVSGISVDLITHHYPMIDPVVEIDGIRIASLKDIAAMKLNAISGNGTRVKDFIDIYFLLTEIPLSAIMESFSLKYGKHNSFHALKSLVYFDDIAESNWPLMILEPNLKLSDIKKRIAREQDNFLKTLV
jgi:predicted nucleotidyltransferase component of viral defense system